MFVSNLDGESSPSRSSDGFLNLLNDAEELDAALAAEKSLGARLRLITSSLKGPIRFSTSFGAEDQVLFHAIALEDVNIEVFTLDTGRHFPETYETLALSERGFAKRVKVVFPDAREVEELVSRDGIMGFRSSIEARKACCHVRKVLPLKRALSGAEGWVTGLRRDQSGARVETPFASFDEGFGLIKINPLADWTLENTEEYIKEHDVPVNPLHAQGYPSIGCQPCTRPIKPGEHIRAGRWWWENEAQKECGLHNRPGFALKKKTSGSPA